MPLLETGALIAGGAQLVKNEKLQETVGNLFGGGLNKATQAHIDRLEADKRQLMRQRTEALKRQNAASQQHLKNTIDRYGVADAVKARKQAKMYIAATGDETPVDQVAAMFVDAGSAGGGGLWPSGDFPRPAASSGSVADIVADNVQSAFSDPVAYAKGNPIGAAIMVLVGWKAYKLIK